MPSIPPDPTEPGAAGAPTSWQEAVDAIGPAWLLVAIRSRMSPGLAARLEPEDVLQEVLLASWRAWPGYQWKGFKALRSWLLDVADNRLRDAVEREGALRRGGGATIVSIDSVDSTRGDHRALVATTTPSRLASYRERADLMQAALAELPDEVRDVVYLRVFEELPMPEVAARLGIGLSGAKHRFRKGIEVYQRKLRAALATSTGEAAAEG